MTILGVPFGRTTQSFFYCNQIQAITAGTPSWGYPFDWDGTKKWGGFSFHMVNRDNEPGMSVKTKIYDACLKVDGGTYPGRPYPESCCFAIGESCYVIWKEGCVYRVLGAQAKEVADCIYKA